MCCKGRWRRVISSRSNLYVEVMTIKIRGGDTLLNNFKVLTEIGSCMNRRQNWNEREKSALSVGHVGKHSHSPAQHTHRSMLIFFLNVDRGNTIESKCQIQKPLPHYSVPQQHPQLAQLHLCWGRAATGPVGSLGP